MSKATWNRVEKAMRRLDYHPDVTAQSLRSARTRTLGFLVLDEHEAFLADPLTAELLSGVGDVARNHHFGILVQSGRPGDGAPDFLTPFRERRIDGAFVLLTGEPEVRQAHINSLNDLGREFVVFDELLEGARTLSVRAADRDGGRLLTEHLLARGHKGIAFIAARVPWAVIEQRFLGYRDALSAAGIKPVKRLERFEAAGYASGGREIADALLKLSSPPTAIICANDLLALQTMRTVLDRGLRVPEDIAVAGFDDFVFSALVNPPLTTVRVPGYEMGQTAATMLIDRIEGGDPLVRQAVFGVELMVRGST
jgi:DNA-binding LacI/PurR family transcriptional regulator